MSAQSVRPFACRQCGFCKDTFRIDGGASGQESVELGAWFCSGGCYNIARLFQSSPGDINQSVRDNLIATYNNCFTFTNKNGDTVHMPKINARRARDDVEQGAIKIIKGQFENTNDDGQFGKYD